MQILNILGIQKGYSKIYHLGLPLFFQNQNWKHFLQLGKKFRIESLDGKLNSSFKRVVPNSSKLWQPLSHLAPCPPMLYHDLCALL